MRTLAFTYLIGAVMSIAHKKLKVPRRCGRRCVRSVSATHIFIVVSVNVALCSFFGEYRINPTK